MNLHSPESPHVCVENDSYELPAECDLVLRQIMHARTTFCGSLCWDLYIFVTAEWVCRWKPCWALIDDTFRTAYKEDWQLLKDAQNYYPVEDSTKTVPCASDSSMLYVPLFVDNLPAAKKHSQLCRCTSVTFTPRNVASEGS